MTAFNTIVGAIVAALQAATPVSNQVYRARMRPVAAQFTDAVVVRIANAQAQRFDIGGAPVDFTTNIAIECYARSATLAPDVAVDALLAAAYARLMADTSLGGLVMDLNLTEINYDFDAEAEQLACATLTLEVRHRVSSTTLT